MATTPGAFFDDYVSPDELSFLTKGVGSFQNLFEAGPAAGQHVSGTSQGDIIFLGKNDTLDGAGGGTDVVVTGGDFTMANDVEAVVLVGSRNSDVTGNDANNKIVGNSGDNVIDAGSGKDVIVANRGNDDVLGGAGNDTVFGDAGNDTIDGGAGKDSLDGGAGNDSILGGTGDDEIFGGTGNDQLFGGAGDDTIMGGAGKDTLVGGDGNDTLFGDDGKDTFVIQAHDHGVDKIMDFEQGDVIDLSGTNTNSFKDLSYASDGHGNTLVTLKDGTQFKLMGIDPGDIKKGWFHF